MPEPQGWTSALLSDVIASLDAGVSVNAEDRPHGADEIGILKTSALNGGAFHPDQNKAVLAAERALVSEPVRADSILFSRMNTPALVGESCYVADDWPTLFVPDRIWQLKPKDRDAVSMRWLSYVLRGSASRAHIETHATGTSGSMKNLSKPRLLDLVVSYPPVSEQRSIATVLDTLDTTIRQTEAIIEKLKQVKQGLLHDLLTRGIGANGELRPPQSQAPHLYKESPLGWIPNEWHADHVGEFVTSIVPGRNKPVLDGGQYPWITVSDLLSDEVRASRLGLSVSADAVRNAAGRTVPAGAVLMSCVGSFGTASVAGCELVANQQLHGFVAGENLRQHWLMHVIRHNAASIDRAATQTTIRYLNKEGCESTYVPVPSLTEQDLMLKRVSSIGQRAQVETVNLRKLQRVKSGLMDDLLTGRVRVTPLLAHAAP